jgi:SAM-dependent methyltransferase
VIGRRRGRSPDGSPVAVFARLPAEPAAGYLRAALPPGADVLELGCGAGRLTRALLDAGHAVVAVDESAAMLRRVDARAERVRADAAALELHRRFGAVVLASYLVNDPGHGADFLAAAARHLAPGGVVVVQRYDPVWVRDATPDAASVGPVTIGVTRVEPDGDTFDATVVYAIGRRRWSQQVRAAIVDDELFATLVAGAGLRVREWLDAHRTWAVLVGGDAPPAG